MPVETLKVAALIGTPIALLSLIAMIIGIVYIRRLGAKEKTLALCPVSERAVLADEFLTRYKIDGSKLIAASKVDLIKYEMSNRNRIAVLLLVAAAISPQ